MKRSWFFFILIFGFQFLNAQVVRRIEFSGNKKTKEKVLLRELTFSVGDHILQKDTLQHSTNSENNLFNTSLFNFTEVTFRDSANDWIVKVNLQERWYIWPEIHLEFQERNFSEWWKNKDLSRLDVGVRLNKLNFLGRNQTLQLNVFRGFTESIGFQYKIPYLTHRQRDGFKIASDYSTQNEVFTDIYNNEMVYIKNDSIPIRTKFHAQLEYFRRTGFYKTQYFNVRFFQYRGSDTLSHYSDRYFGRPDSFLRLMNLSYRFKLDKRFSQNYPLEGYFFDFQWDLFGLGKLDQSNLSIPRFMTSFRIYKKLSSHQFWALGTHINHYFSQNIPFILQSGLGFGQYIRGYEPYILYGTSAGLIKTNYKIQLLAPKSVTLPFIRKFKKFSKMHVALYWNNSFDAGFVLNNNPETNNLTNKILMGIGSGLDWVTYYDVVFRTEYSINQYGEYNFNIAVVAPI